MDTYVALINVQRFFFMQSLGLLAPFCVQDLSKGTMFGVSHSLALSDMSLFLKLKSARSGAAREDTEEANWWSMMLSWKDDRALQLINSHRLQWLIRTAHLEQEKLILLWRWKDW